MSKKKWMNAFAHVDDHVLERYMKIEEKLTSKKQKKKTGWVRWVAIAASICLFISIPSVVALLQEAFDGIPAYRDATYTAEDIAGLDYFGTTNAGGATNAYEKVYTASPEYLNIQEVPDEEVLPIYRYMNKGISLDKAEFEKIVQETMEKLTDFFGGQVPEYEIEEKEEYIGVSAYMDEALYINVTQHEEYYSYGVHKLGTEAGKMIQIDQNQSNEEILTSLEGVKDRLCEIFDIRVDEAKVERRVDHVYVYFYVEDALVEGETNYLSDYITIAFDNSGAYKDKSDTILTCTDIKCYKYRIKTEDQYQVISEERRISLEEAEKLLYKGYVFGGHSCPTCMTEQTEISFKQYDYVGFEYLFDREMNPYRRTIGIPFYTFYKHIGTAENGNQIYAKTYVPAIEVSGLKEYFEAQKKSHKLN